MFSQIKDLADDSKQEGNDDRGDEDYHGSIFQSFFNEEKEALRRGAMCFVCSIPV